MKFCSHCGKEIMDEAVICPSCGCSVKAESNWQETSDFANRAIGFAILIPFVGIILGIIGLCKYKSQQYKTKSAAAILISVICWILWIIIIYCVLDANYY